MRKAIFCVPVIFMLILGGCSTSVSKPSDGASSGPVTITVWHDKEAPVIEALTAELAVLEPDIHVEFEKRSGLTESLKLIGNDRNAAPDLYFFAHDKIGVYAEMGILAPVSDFVDADALDGYLPLTVKGATYKGVRYQLPVYFETLLFMYNKKYMSEADVPVTTEELYGYMQRKTKYGHYGFVEQHSTPYYAAGWIHGFGGTMISEDGTPCLNSPEVLAALEYHKKFAALMPGETEYATVNTLFTEGMAHATIAGPWFVPTVRKAGIDVGTAPMPVVDETGLPLAPYSGIQGFHVLKVHADEKRAAITRVFDILMKPSTQIRLAQVSGCAPALASCYEDERISGDPLIMAMRKTAETAVPMPNIPEMDVMFTVAGSLLTDVNMSGYDPVQAAEKAQQKAVELIEAMK